MYIVKNCSFVGVQTYTPKPTLKGVKKWVKQNPNTPFRVYNTKHKKTQQVLKRKGITGISVLKHKTGYIVVFKPNNKHLTLTQFVKQFCY